MYREWDVFGRLRQTDFGSHPDHKRSRPPSSAVLVVHSTVSALAGNRSVRVSWYARFTRVRVGELELWNLKAEGTTRLRIAGLADEVKLVSLAIR